MTDRAGRRKDVRHEGRVKDWIPSAGDRATLAEVRRENQQRLRLAPVQGAMTNLRPLVERKDPLRQVVGAYIRARRAGQGHRAACEIVSRELAGTPAQVRDYLRVAFQASFQWPGLAAVMPNVGEQREERP
jgi:hypothetical protein